MNVAVIVTAAGSSTRMKSSVKKEFIPFGDGTVLSAACNAFASFFGPDEKDQLAGITDSLLDNKPVLVSLVVTCPKGLEKETENALISPSLQNNLLRCGIKPVITPGGETRQQSVYNGLIATQELFRASLPPDIVLIHDGARPWLTPDVISNVLSFTEANGCAVPAVSSVDTLAVVTHDNCIVSYLDRSRTMRLQTPQGFNFGKLLAAHKQCIAEGRTDCTDDTTVWAACFGSVKICPGNDTNRKITYASDLRGMQL